MPEETGGFAQLVYNFAAEKVQQVTTEWTLVAEQQEYIAEGIEWTHLGYINNSPVVSVIERGSYGIFSILEEVCMSAQNFVMGPPQPPPSTRIEEENESGSSTPSLTAISPDDVFLERVTERFSNHSHVECPNAGGTGSASQQQPGSASGSQQTASDNNEDDASRSNDVSVASSSSKLPHHCFRYCHKWSHIGHKSHTFLSRRIKHFGGTITYDSRDFVSRNRDALDRELSQAMYECDNSILKVLFPEGNCKQTTKQNKHM